MGFEITTFCIGIGSCDKLLKLGIFCTNGSHDDWREMNPADIWTETEAEYILEQEPLNCSCIAQRKGSAICNHMY